MANCLSRFGRLGGSFVLALWLGGCTAGAQSEADQGAGSPTQVDALKGPVPIVSLQGVESTAAPSAQANDFDCKPSSEHPEPVILVHGLGSTADGNWFYHGPRIASAGYCVFALTYGTGLLGPWVGGLASMADSAAELGTFVDKVLASTGASKVDIVGHSEGTTVPAYYMKFLGGDAKVKHFVGFGANYKGTTLHGLSTLIGLLTSVAPGLADLFSRHACASCLEFMPGSPFAQKLNDGGVTVAGPSYTNIVSRVDNVVTPYTSGVVEGAGDNVTNIVLQDACRFDTAGHLGMAIDPNITQLILRGLDPENAAPLRCQPFTTLGI
ncbi:lipase family protein [Pendulispora rubella]|uniref:Lipase family protein n=1 Tax=Pendulispora rubella TaxID=2741070 RepID=A0ABZ2L181_9BACT